MSPLESSYPMISGSKYSNIAEAQEEKDLKDNYMKMTKVLKKKLNKSLNEN